MTGSDRDRTSLMPLEEIERAIDWLRDSARLLGAAKERARKAEHWIKHVEALEYKMSLATSVEAKKADARASDRYLEALTEDAVAAGEYEKLRALREAAALKIEVYRTESANIRAMTL